MPATVDSIITDIIKREGPDTNNPTDKGGRTAYGISEKANPQAWASGRPTEEQARAIYLKKYVEGPGFDKVVDPQLRAQLVDYGVNSGPQLVIQKLQVILGVHVDGVLGPETLATLNKATGVNNQLVAARVQMIAKIVSRDPCQLKFINGWINRALEFLV
jgi:lysozyme family protein